ncbi:MAG: ribonuclease HII [Dehalococcoidales bacterium]|nr:ribonuclease HII [Dehalococcoidales bacterium]
MRSINRFAPTFAEEKLLWEQGYERVAGVDEVGRGALAGPVMAAAVVLPPQLKKAKWQAQVRDSKLLTPQKREALSEYILDAAASVGIGLMEVSVISSEGIARATRLAMKAAIVQIAPPPQYVLIDYFRLPEVPLPQKGVPDGDTLCFSIACASIVAKVSRDRLMVEMDSFYPGYGLAQNKGYGTKEHINCLRSLGPCAIHRRNFEPVRAVLL